MKAALFATLALALTMTALGGAEPSPETTETSQHPRVGQLATIEFAHDSAELAVHTDSPVGRDLGRIAAWGLENPDGLIVLDGHADRTGPADHNVRLSLQRARTVRDELIDLGIDPDQIVIAAFGETGPRGRENRRVVVWGTRAGLDAVVARSAARGEPVIRAGLVTEADRRPRPGAAAR